MKKLAMVLSLLAASSAAAGIEPRFSAAFALPDGRLSINWRLRLVSGALEPGASFSQHFTIYDLPNLIPGVSRQPADWVATFQARGIDADDIEMRGRDDSGKYLNVTWTWTGATRIEAPAELGVFGIDQGSFGGPALQNLFVGQASRTAPPIGPVALIGRVVGARPGASLQDVRPFDDKRSTIVVAGKLSPAARDPRRVAARR